MSRPVVAGLIVAVAFLVTATSQWPVVPGPQASVQAAQPQVQLLRRVQLGGYAEDITLITSGKMKGRIALLVGTEVVSVHDAASGPVTPQRVFDFGAAGAEIGRDLGPRGMVYVEDWDAYVLNSVSDPAALTRYLYLFDARGNYTVWPVAFGAAQRGWGHVEGLTYVPPDVTGWPDDYRGRVLAIVREPTDASRWRVDVLARDESTRMFHVTMQVALPAPLQHPAAWPPYWSDATWAPGGDLLLTAYYDCHLYRWHAGQFEPDGKTAVLTPESLTGCDGTRVPISEGVTTLPDGSVVLEEYTGLTSLTYVQVSAPAGSWDTTRTLDVKLGLGMPFPLSVAWDARRDRFLIGYEHTPLVIYREDAVAAVPASLNAWTPVRVLSEAADYLDRNYYGLAYREATDEVVVARRGRRVEHLPIPWPPAWAETRTPALARFSLASPGAPPAIVDMSDTVLQMAAALSIPALYQPWSWNNGPVGIASRPGDDSLAVRMNGDGRDVFILGADGTWPAAPTLPIDPGMCGTGRFEAGNLAYDAGRDQYLVSGRCPDSRPLLALLDATGHALKVVDRYSELGTLSSGPITAINSGPFAGGFAMVNGHHELFVFKLK